MRIAEPWKRCPDIRKSRTVSAPRSAMGLAFLDCNVEMLSRDEAEIFPKRLISNVGRGGRTAGIAANDDTRGKAPVFEVFAATDVSSFVEWLEPGRDQLGVSSSLAEAGLERSRRSGLPPLGTLIGVANRTWCRKRELAAVSLHAKGLDVELSTCGPRSISTGAVSGSWKGCEWISDRFPFETWDEFDGRIRSRIGEHQLVVAAGVQNPYAELRYQTPSTYGESLLAFLSPFPTSAKSVAQRCNPVLHRLARVRSLFGQT